MKACPYCAEQIQDEALKCRHCGSDVTRAPAVGEGAVAYSHSGHRYLLGYGADFFGIWDRTMAGPAFQRFPRSQEGWDQAWHHFIAREPGAIEVPRTGQAAPAGTVSPLGLYRSAHGLGRALVLLLVGASLTSVAVMFLRLQELGQIHRYLDTPVNAAAPDMATPLPAVAGLGGLFTIATIVVWLIWQHRSQGNLMALGTANLRYSPGWVVGWWFIPFANFVVPYLTLRELWKGSAPERGALDWKQGRASALLGLWWGAWLVSSALSVVAATRVIHVNDPLFNFHDLMRRLAFGAGANAALAVAGVFAVMLVRSIDARQEAKHARLTAWARSGRASEASPAAA